MCTKRLKLCPLELTGGAYLKIQWADKCVAFPLCSTTALFCIRRLSQAWHAGKQLKHSGITLVGEWTGETIPKLSGNGETAGNPM
jgi:hypothetical protein